ncbi:MAG: pyruvate kinase, partial [Nanoarchaeota archaeon]
EQVARHPLVSGVRLNTVMPTKGKLEDVLKRMQDQAQGKDIWIDLKGRQLRVEGYWVPPFTEIQVSHEVELDAPATAYFRDGKEHATVVAVKKDRLILDGGIRRIIGPGESVNIPDASLRIHGYLTDLDKRYIEAAENTGIKTYMLSFVEQGADLASLGIDDLDVIAKIESKAGLGFARSSAYRAEPVRLMAARGDLYVEVERPHQIAGAVRSIIDADPAAIVGSRILESMAQGPEPSCQDISDIAYLMSIGYKTYMLGDHVCLQEESVMGALNVLYAMGNDYGE